MCVSSSLYVRLLLLLHPEPNEIVKNYNEEHGIYLRASLNKTVRYIYIYIKKISSFLVVEEKTFSLANDIAVPSKISKKHSEYFYN